MKVEKENCLVSVFMIDLPIAMSFKNFRRALRSVIRWAQLLL